MDWLMEFSLSIREGPHVNYRAGLIFRLTAVLAMVIGFALLVGGRIHPEYHETQKYVCGSAAPAAEEIISKNVPICLHVHSNGTGAYLPKTSGAMCLLPDGNENSPPRWCYQQVKGSYPASLYLHWNGCENCSEPAWRWFDSADVSPGERIWYKLFSSEPNASHLRETTAQFYRRKGTTESKSLRASKVTITQCSFAENFGNSSNPQNHPIIPFECFAGTFYITTRKQIAGFIIMIWIPILLSCVQAMKHMIISGQCRLGLMMVVTFLVYMSLVPACLYIGLQCQFMLFLLLFSVFFCFFLLETIKAFCVVGISFCRLRNGVVSRGKCLRIWEEKLERERVCEYYMLIEFKADHINGHANISDGINFFQKKIPISKFSYQQIIPGVWIDIIGPPSKPWAVQILKEEIAMEKCNACLAFVYLFSAGIGSILGIVFPAEIFSQMDYSFDNSECENWCGDKCCDACNIDHVLPAYIFVSLSPLLVWALCFYVDYRSTGQSDLVAEQEMGIIHSSRHSSNRNDDETATTALSSETDALSTLRGDHPNGTVDALESETGRCL